MFTKILVPVDGSDNSYRALEAALVLSEKLGSNISVINVMEQVPITHIESEKLLSELLEAYKKENQDKPRTSVNPVGCNCRRAAWL